MNQKLGSLCKSQTATRSRITTRRKMASLRVGLQRRRTKMPTESGQRLFVNENTFRRRGLNLN